MTYVRKLENYNKLADDEFTGNYCGRLFIVKGQSLLNAFVRADRHFNVPENKLHHLVIDTGDGKFFDRFGLH